MGLHADMDAQRFCETLYQLIIILVSVRRPASRPSTFATLLFAEAPACSSRRAWRSERVLHLLRAGGAAV